jgi:hypothetical protein
MYADSFDQKEERTENKPIGEISINIYARSNT